MTNLIDALDDILDRQPASALLGTTSESRISPSFSGNDCEEPKEWDYSALLIPFDPDSSEHLEARRSLIPCAKKARRRHFVGLGHDEFAGASGSAGN